MWSAIVNAWIWSNLLVFGPSVVGGDQRVMFENLNFLFKRFDWELIKRSKFKRSLLQSGIFGAFLAKLLNASAFKRNWIQIKIPMKVTKQNKKQKNEKSFFVFIINLNYEDMQLCNKSF